MHRLQGAGCPLDKDDLTIEQWLDLGQFKGMIE